MKINKGYIGVRVYKDVEVKDDDDYIENAIEFATSDLGGFDVEIIDWWEGENNEN